MKANTKTIQFMVLGRSISDSFVSNISSMKIISTDKVTLLRISIGNKLMFKDHIDELCRKASYRLHALRRVRPFLSKEKARLLENAFINVSFYMLL